MSQRVRYVRGPRCGIGGCKATQYYHQDGQAFCRNNHLVEGELELELEEDEVLALGVGNRLRRVQTETPVVARPEDDAIWFGPTARAGVLQGLQLVLRHQCAFLKQELKDESIEGTVKTLWSHWLVAIKFAKHLPIEDGDEAILSDGEDAARTSDDSDGEGIDGLPGRLVRGAHTSRIQLVDTICLCYLALILHRVPIRLTTIHGWMVSDRLLFNRAASVLPPQLLRRLPQHDLFLFEPRSVPPPRRVWRAARTIATVLARRCGIVFPQLNYAAMLFAQARNLYIPLEVANASVRQMHDITLAGDPFELSHWLVRRPKQHDYPLEVKLWAWLLVIVRLCLSLDGVARQDRTYRAPELARWQAAVQAAIKNTKHIDVISRTTADAIYQFNDEQIDRYLRWYKSACVPEAAAPRRDPGRAPDGILNLFTPPDNLAEPSAAEVLATVEEQIIRRLVSGPSQAAGLRAVGGVGIGGGGMRRGFGEGYVSVEDDEGTPTGLPIFKDLVELAARLADVPQATLYAIMSWIERELAEYARVRAQAAGTMQRH